MKKKGAFQILNSWVEFVTLSTLIVGFVLSLFVYSAFLSYVIVLLCGVMIGGVFYHKKDFVFPWVVITLGFLAGFVIGNRYGNSKLIAVFYIIGMVLSYAGSAGWFRKLHQKSTRSK